MNSIGSIPRRGRIAMQLFAAQALALALLTAAANAVEYSGPQWFAQAFESRPIALEPTETARELPDSCLPAPEDQPLAELTTDIRPRNREHEVVPADGLPEDCAKYVFTQHRFLSIGLDCDSCRPRWCDVLRLAHFQHNPLYFEEVCLERCGQRTCCCQPAASAMHFYGRALMLPVSMVCVCPCACVPAQYCCPDGCCR